LQKIEAAFSGRAAPRKCWPEKQKVICQGCRWRLKDAAISFSGPASEAERLLERGCRPENLARAVEICIADSLNAAVASAWKEENK
jgi:hypothetical protein